MVGEKNNSFTLLELIVSIVVIGLIALVAIPRLARDRRVELRDSVVSAIEYTQHLALTDNQTDPEDERWQMRLWKITFTTSASDNRAFFYTIASDKNQNRNISKRETAIDPTNGKYLYNSSANSIIGKDESPAIFIGKKYGLNRITFAGGCHAAHHVAFDNFGRPHNAIGGARDKFEKIMRSDCKITFAFLNSDIKPLVVEIAKETGCVSWD